MNKNQIKIIQTALQGLGFYNGAIDGDSGPKTRAGLGKLQPLVSALLLHEETITPSRVATGKLPPWLTRANSYLGEKEIRGKGHNPKIVGFWKSVCIPWVRDDETPWCAAFVGAVLELMGFVSTRKGNARSYMNWGIPIDKPCVGAIVVFWRGSRKGWKGHVGIVVGKDKKGRLLVLGGNQGNSVSIKAYPSLGQPGSRVLGYRVPKGYQLPLDYELPVGSAHLTNNNEA